MAADSSPSVIATEVVESLHRAIVDAARLEVLKDRYAELLPTVRATHDLPFIAEVTIRRQWRDLDESARERFVAAFEALSVTTYAARFAKAGPGTFRVIGSEAAGGDRIQVDAEIVRADDENISLAYVLQARDGSYRIVNVLADGVSDLALKRAQYQRVFSDGGTIETLIAELRAETAAL